MLEKGRGGTEIADDDVRTTRMYGYVHMYGVHKFAISSDLIDLGAKVRGFFFSERS